MLQHPSQNNVCRSHDVCPHRSVPLHSTLKNVNAVLHQLLCMCAVCKLQPLLCVSHKVLSVTMAQVVIVPITKKDADVASVLAAAQKLQAVLVEAGVRCKLDDRLDQSPGFKYNDYEMRVRQRDLIPCLPTCWFKKVIRRAAYLFLGCLPLLLSLISRNCCLPAEHYQYIRFCRH